jgi:hypothetical protein
MFSLDKTTMPYAVITRQPNTIVIDSPSHERLYKYIVDITGSGLVISILDVDIVEKMGYQSITNEAMIVKDSGELLNFELGALAVFVDSEKASRVDWTSDLSEFYLQYFRARAFNPAPDLSELKQVVIENLSLKAEFLNDYEQLKLYKDIIQRRFSIKAHEDAFETMATLPNY